MCIESFFIISFIIQEELLNHVKMSDSGKALERGSGLRWYIFIWKGYKFFTNDV